MIPVLDKYYPTSKYRDTFLTKIISFYSILSSFLFFVGAYYFAYNLIKSINAYYKIKKKWK
jgi:hypothetical protein